MKTQFASRYKVLVAPLLIASASFLCGLILGLPILGWWLWPVEYVGVPTYTPYPTYTPISLPTLVPTITPSPTATSTPIPDALVLGANVNLMDGPEQSYAVVGQVDQANELTVIGQYGNCSWLKVTTPAQATGWLPNDGSTITLQKPCDAISAGTFRPSTHLIKSFSGTGEGQLTTDNGLDLDAIIILSNASAPVESVASAYIRAGEKFTLTGVPDGEYIVFFSSGSEWNGTEFTTDRRVKRFEETFNFVTSTLQYTIWNISLHPVPGGTGRSETVPPEEFPSVN